MNNPLQGKHAIITGGGTGIGAAIADTLTELGARVTLMGRRLDVLSDKADSLAGASAIAVDVCDEASVTSAFAQAGDYDILINNAGLAQSAPVNRTSLAHWDKTISVNLTGVFLCSKHAVDMLRKKDYGRIITIASTAGLTGYGYVSAYCAAKHGAIGFTKALAKEMARTATTVNAVCPGYTETAILSDTIANIVSKTGCTEQAARDQLLVDNPQKKFIQPNEVASITASLCLAASNSITGQAIAVDGGETA
ncbi:SDR family NAD(P)-dependent oxidoreductase [Arenicella xantha]|uniref:NAD(P)-dependent dehydrogenase (Short-subunit alcohol dehydrogenase family) n=1 Tax=Arenicella xantha TaxID=644221 RepID=A0A395JSP1_9GAMM|nr:SDR family NAD(P)-dependent oxidoreductase [Arenicella xantha]RBP53555.1 NAD(P)-dependent dehydrogenase (short-subunit alcohol dehydrogenase family) [Arenicella xantha]